MAIRLILETLSPDESTTRRLGAVLGRWLRAGDVVAVQGPLGAGKTRFIQGLAKGLGVTDPVQSPSFVLIQAYPLPDGGRLYHVDLYRLSEPGEAWALGLWDLFEEPAVIAIEWPERAAGLIPEPYLRVTLSPLGDSGRRVRIEAIGEFPPERLEALLARLKEQVETG
ncbi:tRNA (adenosine(37)-N6)-threonylcarbamoyltransferase complex ATPase subunit type 1 TsaE [Thermoflexus sp.]|uniref:tRNA (adenosine(37)-N6)-threonylcarbamoyltransferase complex ATPase subunit type 1 TsaE n=1 Tax=Thermoflexus sp. TaxID=1969742 RepID=UPI003C0768E2